MTSVQTVLGPIDSGEMGVTLMHEHTLRSPPELPYDGVRAFSAGLKHQAVTAENAWLVREDPYVCLDNRRLTDLEPVADEIGLFTAVGGRTLVDNSNGAEREPELLVRLAERTRVNLVMGSGWSIVPGSTTATGTRSAESYADDLIEEHVEGVELPDGRRVRPGIIGEIGVGPLFTEAERTALHAASLAQIRLGVPLLIHLPGWRRLAHEVLDVVLGSGVDPRAVVLCHMDPSGIDPDYQHAVAERGAWLEFDMIGMLNNYPGEGQSPSPGQTADAVASLVAAGHGSRILLSQDVGMKTMWTRFGGNGYAFVQSAFLPRLRELGVDEQTISSFLTDNPREVFEAASHSPRKAPIH